ncbi:MAG: nucleoside deaminase [Acidimicrobiia bacterium]
MSQIVITLPDWIGELAPPVDQSLDGRMRYVLALAERNVAEGTGGPFGAAVFSEEGLVAPGVNLVVPSNVAIAHAEATAVALAGQRTGSFDLRGMALVTSSEPCVMCFGVTWWSGVTQLVCGARDADVRQIGFDEGPKRADWAEALAAKGVEVVRDVLRTRAVTALRTYAAGGGLIYNGGKPDA